MNRIFDKIQNTNVPKSAFDLSCESKLSCKMGQLIPCYVREIVPGDQFRIKTESMIRLAPMLAPVMHRIDAYIHYFFVPNRIIWNQWEDFITGGDDGMSNPVYPEIELGSPDPGDLADYLGLPPKSTGINYQVSELPFRAYHLIWSEYYRDQNLQPEFDPHGSSFNDKIKLRNRAWEKDYFTSSLPFPQKGPEVGVNATIEYLNTSQIEMTDGDPLPSGAHSLEAFSSGADGSLNVDQLGAAKLKNLEQVGIDINDLRKSSALQRWFEKQARGGSRYTETILNHFGIKSSDSRLQRPEYLGGGQQPVQISEVLNTSATDTEPQGEMTGHGIAIGETHSAQGQFEEHGYLMGILSVIPRSSYHQGIPRHFSRRDKTEYYWPEFAHLGEQEVKYKEIIWNDIAGTINENTFGYQQRYAEYKYARNTVHGDFRDSLKFWHLSRELDLSSAVLNGEFIECKPQEVNRIFAVQDGTDHLWIQLYHDVKARRPMPYFADPKLT